MSARVLVVDDIMPNVKLLEAKLKNEYFEVLTAMNGPQCLELAEKQSPDIILLDVMMPGMDGFEVCKRLKANIKTAHIPVVMVTALTDTADRVRGLESGADDFLSKPINDIALMSRVRSLVRLKMIIDEWRTREKTASQFGVEGSSLNLMEESFENARILVIEDKSFESEKFLEALKRDDDNVVVVTTGQEGLEKAVENSFDMIVVSLNLEAEDGLRLCSHLRSHEHTRSVPILMIAEDGDMKRVAQGLEIGAHDYIIRPVDRNELLARTRTQIRRKRYQNHLRANYEDSLSMAVSDSLTGLFNRRYLSVHGEKLLLKAKQTEKSLAVLVMDLDHFKSINDNYGHAVGDQVLKEFASRVSQRLRSFDLVARYGGEEFVALLPDVTQDMALQVAERLREGVANTPITIKAEAGSLTATVSIGGIWLAPDNHLTLDQAIDRADKALYEAKAAGRNRAVFDGLGEVIS
jgi:two-component system cell cycle response regulator